MDVEDFTPEQVRDALKEIEKRYTNIFRQVDLLEMSKNNNIYPTWLKLRNIARKQDAAAKAGAAACNS